MKLIPENIPHCSFLFMEIFSRYYFFSCADWDSQSNNYLINVPCISYEYSNIQSNSLGLKLLKESGWKCFSAVLPLVINSSYGNKSWIYKGWSQLRLILEILNLHHISAWASQCKSKHHQSKLLHHHHRFRYKTCIYVCHTSDKVILSPYS